MSALKMLRKKYKVSDDDLKKVIGMFLADRYKEGLVDGVIVQKYHDIKKTQCEVNQHSKTNLNYSSPIQEWAMLYLESFENQKDEKDNF